MISVSASYTLSRIPLINIETGFEMSQICFKTLEKCLEYQSLNEFCLNNLQSIILFCVSMRYPYSKHFSQKYFMSLFKYPCLVQELCKESHDFILVLISWNSQTPSSMLSAVEREPQCCYVKVRDFTYKTTVLIQFDILGQACQEMTASSLLGISLAILPQ